MAASFVLARNQLSPAARGLFEYRRRAAGRALSLSRLPEPPQRRWTARVAFFLLASLFLLPSVASAAGAQLGSTSNQTNASASASSQGENQVQELELGKPIERELAGGQHHTYQVTLASGQFLHAIVEPHSVPMTVTLFAPGAKPVIKLAVPAGSSEPLFLVAEEQGPYRIEIGSDEGAEAGSYRLRIEELLAATPQDSNLAVAQSTFSDGEQLRKEGSAESRQKAVETYKQAVELWRAAGDRRGTAEALLGLGMVHWDLSEHQKALEYLNEALPLFRAVGNRDGEAETLDNIGETYDILGERRKALDFFNQALPLRRAVGDRDGEGKTLNNLGAVYFKLGQEQRALDYYHQALPLRHAAADRAGEAQTLADIGLVYNSLGENPKALDYYHQSLALARAARDRPREAVTLNDIAGVHHELGERQEALDLFNEVLLLAHTVGDRVLEGMTLGNIGVVYNSLGNRQKALDYYLQSLLVARALGDRDSESSNLSNMGEVYEYLGEARRALDCYHQALPLARMVGNRQNEGAILSNIGQVYDSLGRKQAAMGYYRQALVLQRAMGDRSGEAETLNNMGLVYSSLEKGQKALDYYEQALQLWRGTGNRAGEGRTLNDIGQVYATIGEKQKALDYFGQALPLRRAVGDRAGEATTLGNIALVERETGHLVEALSQIEASIQIIESLRTNVVSEELRASYFSTVQNNYALYIDVLMRLHQLHPDDRNEAKAVEVSERSRARSLLDTLAEAQADIRQGADPALLERERSLKQLLKGKEEVQIELLNGKHTDEQAAALKKEIADILAQYEEVEGQIRVTSPRYAALTQPQPLKTPEIQQQLDTNTLLLEYALGHEHSYLWAVGPDSLRSFQLPKRSDVETAARRFYGLLTARNKELKGETEAQRQARLQQAEAQYPQAATTLSRMLLGPVAPLMKGKRLVIVADGALQYIPFSALPEPLRSTIANSQAASVKQASLTPLIVQHEVVSLPSASTLAVLRQEIKGRQPASNMVAVLADPVFDAQDPRVERTARRSEPGAAQQAQKAAETRAPEGKQTVPDPETASLTASLTEGRLTRSATEVGLGRGELHFPRLAFSRREAQDILSAAPTGKGMMAVDFKANLQTAADPELSHYRIVHFATHGLLNSEHPELSGLVLSLVDQQGRPQDGFLQLQDIYNLNLPADLVVLSACETGLGKEIRGEGLMGLTRGFMYAGAGRVIASLWKVDDVATAELMKRLYHAMLIDGLPPAAALRQSQIMMWKQRPWQSPYYWAAFIIQGEWR